MITKTVEEMQVVAESYMGDYRASCEQIQDVSIVRESSINGSSNKELLEDLPDKFCLLVTLKRETGSTMRLPGLYEGVKVYYRVQSGKKAAYILP